MESKKLQTIEGFTPGPWLVDTEKSVNWRYSLLEVPVRSAKERDANARLIAAAPYLLED